MSYLCLKQTYSFDIMAMSEQYHSSQMIVKLTVYWDPERVRFDHEEPVRWSLKERGRAARSVLIWWVKGIRLTYLGDTDRGASRWEECLFQVLCDCQNDCDLRDLWAVLMRRRDWFHQVFFLRTMPQQAACTGSVVYTSCWLFISLHMRRHCDYLFSFKRDGIYRKQ